MEKPLENKDFLANLGYEHPLYILPFDHRTGLYKTFGWTEPLTPEQVEAMKAGRRLIYDAIKKAVDMGIPKNAVPVFTDDTFGADVLVDAAHDGFMTVLTTEKSGTHFFDFEHGNTFADTIQQFKPTFTKALVRYNPEGNKDDNRRSLENLKRLSDFSHEHGYKFIIEPLIAATEDQLDSIGGAKDVYDETLRPSLTTRMITEMHEAGVEPDIWKIEGFKDPANYALVVAAARVGGRDRVSIISLGRNETDETVEQWLRAGSQTPGVIGFAIGRTIFLEALQQFQSGTLSHDEAVQRITEKFFHFYQVFAGKE
jgi:5-dehydro-2-deoxygluconokinase